MSFAFSSIGLWPHRRAQLTPQRVAIRIDDRSVTYAELDARAARCANALTAAGIGPGDRVAAYLDTGLEYVDLLFACARIGAILVPLSTRLAPPELAFMTEDSGAALLVYDAARAEAVKAFRPQTGVRAAFAVGDADDPSYEAAVAAASPEHEPADIGPDEVLAIFYTSGTTGRPKGAMLTHGNFFWTNLNMLVSSGFEQDERTLVVLPLFHVGGWNVNTLAVWWVGGTVLLERSFDPERALALIAEQRVTSMMGVPTIYQMMADDPSFAATDLSSVRTFVCGGAPLPVSLIERYQQRGIRFVQGYGLTEAAPNCLILPPEDAVVKAGAAGRPYFFTDVRVVDEADEPVPPGGAGEVIVRGPSVMKGYWRRPEETARALRGGWLRTGDVGRIDADGYVFIVDRVKDMFISGGENVYPAEVEGVLHGHPDVAEAAVIGVPDERWGEVGRAIVVLRSGATTTEAALKTFCAEQLARFKVPTSVVFADTLPRNATGKLLKQQLRERHGAAS
ncbi:MAG TPA: long-chain fatty acid--CoA ligase [Actinomycetota bacterium]